ncbi:hypothetical protein AURDEDRAFT_117832 [Auricularia subglabra TFB-10046 SS5]|uniref:Uncharacterized protein n=1 Tax=Auricularia subglabra (strain TFB-10046 / SS5) TaxID=717982 RepID=J0WPC4_AURST|nr:hypothetical protein AURDEDRAFT_117832 [Auricularia subglabra TFB-10046 SS5]
MGEPAPSTTVVLSGDLTGFASGFLDINVRNMSFGGDVPSGTVGELARRSILSPARQRALRRWIAAYYSVHTASGAHSSSRDVPTEDPAVRQSLDQLFAAFRDKAVDLDSFDPTVMDGVPDMRPPTPATVQPVPPLFDIARPTLPSAIGHGTRAATTCGATVRTPAAVLDDGIRCEPVPRNIRTNCGIAAEVIDLTGDSSGDDEIRDVWPHRA